MGKGDREGDFRPAPPWASGRLWASRRRRSPRTGHERPLRSRRAAGRAGRPEPCPSRMPEGRSHGLRDRWRTMSPPAKAGGGVLAGGRLTDERAGRSAVRMHRGSSRAAQRSSARRGAAQLGAVRRGATRLTGSGGAAVRIRPGRPAEGCAGATRGVPAQTTGRPGGNPPGHPRGETARGIRRQPAGHPGGNPRERPGGNPQDRVPEEARGCPTRRSPGRPQGNRRVPRRGDETA